MPLIRPEIQQVLREAGLAPSRKTENREAEPGSVSAKLEAAGLGLDETLERYADLACNTSNEVLRKNALDTILKMHGALKEAAAAPPSFTIVIQSSGEASAPLVAGTNPILLPRQLLKELKTTEAEAERTEAKLN